jgi:hypothetical protein
MGAYQADVGLRGLEISAERLSATVFGPSLAEWGRMLLKN